MSGANVCLSAWVATNIARRLGQAALRDGSLVEAVGMVRAWGFESAVPTCRIVVPSWIAATLANGLVVARTLVPDHGTLWLGHT